MDYWKECISEAFEDASIVATDEQIKTVVSWVEGAYENYGLVHGHYDIPNPQTLEINRLKKELRDERDKDHTKEEREALSDARRYNRKLLYTIYDLQEKLDE